MRIFFAVFLFFAFSCSNSQSPYKETTTKPDSILKIEMHLSSFGVESDDFPSIDAIIDFNADTSFCKKWYYNPEHKNSIYRLSGKEMETIKSLLKIQDLEKINKEYKVPHPDQPRSKTIIYTNEKVFVIEDYGMIAGRPMKELYKIVYKF